MDEDLICEKAEEWLTEEDEKSLKAVENSLLGSLRSYEFIGDLWSQNSFDTLRWLWMEAYKQGLKDSK